METKNTWQSQRRAAAKPGGKFCYPGSLTDLQDEVLLSGIYGEWQEKPNGVWRHVTEDRAGLNWASTTKRIWFDGPDLARDRFQRGIRSLLKPMATPSR